PNILILVAIALAQRYTPAWGAWQADGVPLCTAASNQLGTVSVSDGAGGAIVAWYDYRSSEADIYAQHVLPSGVADAAWPASGLVLCAASGGQEAPVHRLRWRGRRDRRMAGRSRPQLRHLRPACALHGGGGSRLAGRRSRALHSSREPIGAGHRP